MIFRSSFKMPLSRQMSLVATFMTSQKTGALWATYSGQRPNLFHWYSQN